MVEEVFGTGTPLSAFEQHGGHAEHPDHHPNGVHVKFDNGWVVSIQWGPGNYCDNRDMFIHFRSRDDWSKPAPSSSTAEVACWKGDGGDMVSFGDDCVKGWCSWEQVQRLLEGASEDALTEPIDLGPDDSRRTDHGQ